MTRCLEGTFEPSLDVARCRSTSYLAGRIVRERRHMSFDICRWWLPVWLPGNLPASLMFESVLFVQLRSSRVSGRRIRPRRNRPEGAMPPAHPAGFEARTGPQARGRNRTKGATPAHPAGFEAKADSGLRPLGESRAPPQEFWPHGMRLAVTISIQLGETAAWSAPARSHPASGAVPSCIESGGSSR